VRTVNVSKLVVALATCFVLVAYACANQSEGQVCDTRLEGTGDSDCESGLACMDTSLLNLPTGATAIKYRGRCCPLNRAAANEEVCKPVQAINAGDAAVPPTSDAGSSAPDGATDDGGDAGGGADAGIDATVG